MRNDKRRLLTVPTMAAAPEASMDGIHKMPDDTGLSRVPRPADTHLEVQLSPSGSRDTITLSREHP